MKAKDIVTGIKELIKMSAVKTEEVALAAFMLADGTELEAIALEIGNEVTIAGVIAPAGSYELEDGTVIEVDDAGIIASITPKAEEAPEVEVEVEQEATPEVIALQDSVIALEEALVLLSEQYATIMADVEALKANKVEVAQSIEAIQSAPAVKPVMEQTQTTVNEPLTVAERIEVIKKLRK